MTLARAPSTSSASPCAAHQRVKDVGLSLGLRCIVGRQSAATLVWSKSMLFVQARDEMHRGGGVENRNRARTSTPPRLS